jgi:hypothetical protein
LKIGKLVIRFLSFHLSKTLERFQSVLYPFHFIEDIVKQYLISDGLVGSDIPYNRNEFVIFCNRMRELVIDSFVGLTMRSGLGLAQLSSAPDTSNACSGYEPEWWCIHTVSHAREETSHC